MKKDALSVWLAVILSVEIVVMWIKVIMGPELTPASFCYIAIYCLGRV